MASAARLLAALLVPLGSACVSEPVAPLPQPLRVHRVWTVPDDAEARGFLGLKTRENLQGGFASFESALDGGAAGLRVVRVVENSPAARAGIQVEDVVLRLDGAELADPGTFEALVREKRPEDLAVLEVERGDQRFRLSVPLAAERSTSEGAIEVTTLARLDPSRSRAGWLTVEGGVRLALSHPEAPFPRDGVPVGSVIHALDGTPQRTDLGLLRDLQGREPGSVVEVDATLPGGERRRVEVRLLEPETRVTRVSIPILFGYTADPEGASESWTLIDLWFVSLLRYERRGEERHLRILRFIHFATGVGELSE